MQENFEAVVKSLLEWVNFAYTAKAESRRGKLTDKHKLSLQVIILIVNHDSINTYMVAIGIFSAGWIRYIDSGNFDDLAMGNSIH